MIDLIKYKDQFDKLSQLCQESFHEWNDLKKYNIDNEYSILSKKLVEQIVIDYFKKDNVWKCITKKDKKEMIYWFMCSYNHEQVVHLKRETNNFIFERELKRFLKFIKHL